MGTLLSSRGSGALANTCPPAGPAFPNCGQIETDIFLFYSQGSLWQPRGERKQPATVAGGRWEQGGAKIAPASSLEGSGLRPGFLGKKPEGC